MKMKKTAVILGSMCMFAGAQMAQAALYDVTGVFYEPMLQGPPPVNTVFTGTFDWDDATKTLTALEGTMNASMQGLEQIYNLSNQLAFDYNPTTGDVVASVFSVNSTDVFMGGGYNTGDRMKFVDPATGLGNENTYFTLAFNANTMMGNLDGMVYGDCAPGGLMGDMCMTGHSAGGTMMATPLSLSITPSAVPVPAAVWLFGSGLLGLVGVARRKLA